MKRTLAEELTNLVGQTVTLYGWVQTKRNHGKIGFIDLRDRTGVTQVVFLPNHKDFSLLETLSTESVVSITGEVVKRPEGMINKDLITGTVELQAHDLQIISKAKTLPFEIENSQSVNEELRLKHRYLDMRNPKMAWNMKLRSDAMQFVSNYLVDHGFTYIHTPILTKSTPEGARDFLVPSRVHAGKFFALPQSPQQYKQLLMVAGIERYFQISPCFRDEAARADRSPGEFYQIDIEMSFVEQEDILNLAEDMFTKLVQKLTPEKTMTFTPWPRLNYDEVMEKYGTDKPDLRKDKTNPKELAFAWVINFPLFVPQTKDDFFHGSGKSDLAPSHHMFTAPKKEDIPLLDTDPAKVRSYQHDLVLNGLEVGGGSIRIHDPEIQEKVWDIIGFNEEQKKSFAHLIEAFQYGVPPHGGIAPGFDRLVSILAEEQNIREVTPFPLNGEVRDPLMGSPSIVNDEQLKEAHIKITS